MTSRRAVFIALAICLAALTPGRKASAQESTPEAAPQPEVEQQLEAEAQPEAETQPEAEPQPAPEAQPEAEQQLENRPQPEAAPQAAPASPPSSNSEGARTHFTRGMEYVQRQLWEPALAEFDESLRLHSSSSALFNRALCLQRLQRFQAAMRVFREYLQRYEAQTTPEQRAHIEQAIEDLRRVLTEVAVEVAPAGAAISVDNVPIGSSPLVEPLMLHSGEHRVEVTLEGFEREERNLMVVSGRPLALTITLAPTPRFGRLRVTSVTPGVRLTLDGHAVPQPYIGDLREGEHTVTARADGYGGITRIIGVVADETVTEELFLERDRRPHRAWFYTLLGLTAAGTVTFAGLAGRVVYYDRHYDPLSGNAFEWYDDGHRLMIAADVTLGVTLGLAVATFVLGFFTNWDRVDALENSVLPAP